MTFQNHDVNNQHINAIIESLPDEIIEIFAPLIEDYCNANCLNLLKHELEIMYHFQELMWLMVDINISQDSGDFVWGEQLKIAAKVCPQALASVIYNIIVLRPNINRNHMTNPPTKMFNGFNQLTMHHQNYCIAHSNNNNNNYSCVSHVNYVAKKMRNADAKLVAQIHQQQFMFLSLDVMNAFLAQNENKDEKIALIAQNLRNNQKSWLCYYCQELNEKTDDKCHICKKGLNPLYFSKQNSSKHFRVNPDKFGIFTTSPTPDFEVELVLQLFMLCKRLSYCS